MTRQVQVSGVSSQVESLSGLPAFSVIVPTLNAGARFGEWTRRLKEQTVSPQQVMVLDSSSTDGTADLARDAGFELRVVEKENFDHGGTRQRGVELTESEIVVFLTDDAMLWHPEALESLVGAFRDRSVGAAYGRQVPRASAGLIEAHERLFNYPEVSTIKSRHDRDRLGLKTAFLSNSFAAYRREALGDVGGFPDGTIFGEDQVVTAKLLLRGWKVAYVAEAMVGHSHAYGLVEQFKRYFDHGVLHARERWILRSFGSAGGEGARFVQSEVRYILARDPKLVSVALLRTAVKYAGYRLGLIERTLPTVLKRSLSMNRRFWSRRSSTAEAAISKASPSR